MAISDALGEARTVTVPAETATMLSTRIFLPVTAATSVLSPLVAASILANFGNSAVESLA